MDISEIASKNIYNFYILIYKFGNCLKINRMKKYNIRHNYGQLLEVLKIKDQFTEGSFHYEKYIQ